MMLIKTSSDCDCLVDLFTKLLYQVHMLDKIYYTLRKCLSLRYKFTLNFVNQSVIYFTVITEQHMLLGWNKMAFIFSILMHILYLYRIPKSFIPNIHLPGVKILKEAIGCQELSK